MNSLEELIKLEDLLNRLDVSELSEFLDFAEYNKILREAERIVDSLIIKEHGGLNKSEDIRAPLILKKELKRPGEPYL